MANTNNGNPYGMRVIGQMNNIVGLLWTVEEEKLVLYFYYRDEYNNYSCDQLEEIPLASVCKGGNVNDALSKLKRFSNRAKPSYRTYMTRDCFNAIEEKYAKYDI